MVEDHIILISHDKSKVQSAVTNYSGDLDYVVGIFATKYTVTLYYREIKVTPFYSSVDYRNIDSSGVPWNVDEMWIWLKSNVKSILLSEYYSELAELNDNFFCSQLVIEKYLKNIQTKAAP